jgi:hypothetical protein
VKLNPKEPLQDETQRSTKATIQSLRPAFLPMQERPSAKKLLAYHQGVNEGFAKTA